MVGILMPHGEANDGPNDGHVTDAGSADTGTERPTDDGGTERPTDDGLTAGGSADQHSREAEEGPSKAGDEELTGGTDQWMDNDTTLPPALKNAVRAIIRGACTVRLEMQDEYKNVKELRSQIVQLEKQLNEQKATASASDAELKRKLQDAENAIAEQDACHKRKRKELSELHVQLVAGFNETLASKDSEFQASLQAKDNIIQNLSKTISAAKAMSDALQE